MIVHSHNKFNAHDPCQDTMHMIHDKNGVDVSVGVDDDAVGH